MFALSLARKQYIANRSTEIDFQDKYLVDYDPEEYNDYEKLRLNGGAKLDVSMILGDAFLSTTTCVLSILGALSVIRITPSAAYALVGVSGAITLAWIGLTIKSHGKVIIYSKNLLVAAVTLTPKKQKDRIIFDQKMKEKDNLMQERCTTKEPLLREALFGKVTYLSPSTPQ